MKEKHYLVLLRFWNKSTWTIEVILYFLFVTGLFALIALKAFWVPPTQDEVTSFFEYEVGGWGHVFLSSSTNNHFLNSFLGKLSMTLFGESMFAFRLPNLIAYLLYAIYAWRISTTLSLFLRWSLVSGLLMCYPLFEYFGLARGYGLSFAFIVCHLYYLLRYQQTLSTRYFALAVISITLGISANLTLLSLGIFSGVALLSLALINDKLGRTQIALLVFLSLAVFAFSLVGFKHQDIIKEFFNRDDGFVETTLHSVINMIGFSVHSPLTLWVIALPLLTGVILLFTRDSTPLKAIKSNPFALLLLALLSNIFATVLLSTLFEIHYPTQRVGLYFIPLYLVTIAFAISGLSHWSKHWISTLLILPSLILVTRFVDHFEINKSRVEPYAYLPENIYKAILLDFESAQPKAATLPVVLADERLSYAWRFHNYSHNHALNPILSINPALPYNYRIGSDEPEKEEVKVAEFNGVFVFRHSFPIAEKLTLQKNIDHLDDLYIPIANQKSIWINDPTIFSTQLRIELDQFSKVALVLVLKDSLGSDIFYSSSVIDDLVEHQSSFTKRSWALQSCANCEIILYLHNVSRTKVSVR